MNSDFLGQVRGFQAGTDAVLEPLALRVGIEAEHGDLTTAASTQAFKNLDCRGFARAVRPEQSEHFSRLDFEVNAFYGFHFAVRLLEAVDQNRWRSRTHIEIDRLLENDRLVKKGPAGFKDVAQRVDGVTGRLSRPDW